MNRAYLIQKIWYESYLPVFLEKFVLPVLAASVVALIVLNPLKWDWRQRISLFLGVLFLAYFVAYTLYKSTRKEVQSPAQVATPAPTGPASTSGPESPAVTGGNNQIQYGASSPPEKKKPAKPAK